MLAGRNFPHHEEQQDKGLQQKLGLLCQQEIKNNIVEICPTIQVAFIYRIAIFVKVSSGILTKEFCVCVYAC